MGIGTNRNIYICAYEHLNGTSAQVPSISPLSASVCMYRHTDVLMKSRVSRLQYKSEIPSLGVVVYK